jgi:hypothetical protein
MIDTGVGWLLVVTVPVTMMVLGTTIWLSIQTYEPGRLRFELTKLAREDVLLLIQFPEPLTSDERDRLQNALDDIKTRLRSVDEADLDRARQRAFDLTARFYANADEPFEPDEIEARADEASARAVARFARRVDRAAPMTVVRSWSYWAALEQVRLLAVAALATGFGTARVLVVRARTPVTDGTIIGLLGGMWAWALLSRTGTEFGAYIGVATAFGLFGGLVALAWVVVAESLSSEIRDVSRAEKVLAVGFFVILAVLVVLASEGALPFAPEPAER